MLSMHFIIVQCVHTRYFICCFKSYQKISGLYFLVTKEANYKVDTERNKCFHVKQLIETEDTLRIQSRSSIGF